MAQIIWDASKYASGQNIKLQDLGWALSQFAYVTEIGATGRKYWQFGDDTSNFSDFIVYDQALSAPYEILLTADFTGTELSLTNHGLACAVRAGRSYTVPTFLYQVSVNSGGTNTTTKYTANISYTTNNDVTSLAIGSAMAVRYQLGANGTDIKMKAWSAPVGQLEANEPVAWNHEGTIGFAPNPTTHYMGIADLQGIAQPNRVSMVSIGTGGDPALFSLPEQSITTPSALNATSVTDTSATLNWT